MEASAIATKLLLALLSASMLLAVSPPRAATGIDPWRSWGFHHAEDDARCNRAYARFIRDEIVEACRTSAIEYSVMAQRDRAHDWAYRFQEAACLAQIAAALGLTSAQPGATARAIAEKASAMFDRVARDGRADGAARRDARRNEFYIESLLRPKRAV